MRNYPLGKLDTDASLTGDRIKRVEIRENVSDFSQGQRELSVITRCPY